MRFRFVWFEMGDFRGGLVIFFWVGFDVQWRTKWLPSADGAVLMLVGANVGVFMLWHLADPSFMRRHFMVSDQSKSFCFCFRSGWLSVAWLLFDEQISLDNFKSGRLHTLLTNAFSHAESGHLISNMIGLYFFGSSVRCSAAHHSLLLLQCRSLYSLHYQIDNILISKY